jgi:hypothetical protein
MAVTPMHPMYRCEDGRAMHSLHRLDERPAMLPCNHVLEGTGDVCPKRARLVG